jgi:diaminopimelate decarboxylase
MDETGRNPTFAIEPGRFLVAESGACLTEVHSTKVNCGIRFVGTDLGFNFLPRPELYGAYHEIIHATKDSREQEKVTVVGNVCESGDYLGRDRILPKIKKGDILLVRDTGAYSFSMASNYNSMSRPVELLLQTNGRVKLIRKRETHKDLIRNQIY